MEQFEAVGMNQQINSEIEFVVIKMAQFIVNVILSFKDLKTFDQVMWREFQVLNSPKDKSVQSPTLCLMSNVMIMRNVIAVKIHILNAKYFHHQTQLMPLVLSELMELVDAYLLQNVRNSDDAQMLLLLQMMNASLMDQNGWNQMHFKISQFKLKQRRTLV